MIYFILFGGLLSANLSDYRNRIVKNRLSLGLIPIFFLITFLTQGLTAFKGHLLAAMLMTIIWWPFWLLKFIGGGDHKLLIMVASALGLNLVVPVSLATAVAGGVQSVVYLAAAKKTRPQSSWRELMKTVNLPYSFSVTAGVAIALIGRLLNYF